MAKKLGLCLGSGGARGIAHVGVLQALNENHIPIHCISGCSMGALVGGLYAHGYTPERLKEIAVNLKKSDIIELNLVMVRDKSLLKATKLDNYLTRFFGDTTFDELTMPFSCIASDLYSGSLVTFNEGSVKRAIRASCSIPGGFPPIKQDKMLLVDGGIINRTPVKQARDLGAEVVLAVDVLTEVPKSDSINNIFTLCFRAMDIMSANVCKLHDKEEQPDLLLVPELDGVSQYKVEQQLEIYESGYEFAIKHMNDIKDLVFGK